MQQPKNIFSLSSVLKHNSKNSFRSLFYPFIEKLLGFKKLGEIYQYGVEHAKSEKIEDFFASAHELMNVTYQVGEGSIDRVPATGPLIVVSNHPYGGVEATILLRMLKEVRPDVKFMANYLLDHIPISKEFCIFVNPFGSKNAFKQNLKPLRESIEWVKNGGVLCIFPSGTVSHFHWSSREVTDPSWSETIGRIIRGAKCPVLPIFFPGHNGPFFQTLGVIHPLLRTLMLGREIINKANKSFSLKIGNLISFQKLSTFVSDEDLTAYLRLRTYILGNQSNVHAQAIYQDKKNVKNNAERVLEKIIPPVEVSKLEEDVARITTKNILVENGELLVYFARAKQIPNILREIGRLREVAFRHVHEGSGKEIDLDQYDNYYTHLFIWNKNKKEIAGAYRLVKADRVLRKLGNEGLYSSTLFNYKAQILEQMGPAIELGRSFISLDYQKNYTSLLLLWKGIATYVVRNPRYKILFGPVSINNEYDSISRELIRMFLKANNFLPDLARMIKARNPMGKTKVLGMDIETTSVVVKDINDVADLLQDIQSRQKSVPVLLKQYLKLGGKLLGFNVDTSFGDVLDGLIFVDLMETDTKLLERYMGKEGIRKFYAYYNRVID
ncbi:MAG: lysophospholipid acyltransferase family protein [Proteobacteria bacterium]|nr:lysophospholipid acyltransferase family protein [Pseudomonadota bacterium]